MLPATNAVAQTPQDDQLMTWERSINHTRIPRLRALAPQMMPNCQIAATDTELADFFLFWRGVANDESAKKAKFDAGVAPGTVFPVNAAPEIPLTALEAVDAKLPGATDAAKEQIEIWHLYRCVDTEFHGVKYFGTYGYDGVVKPGNIPVTFYRVPNTETVMRLPDMSAVEPIEALGKFFRAAEARGLLTFTDSDEETYFFQRYETDYFVKLRESDVTRRWFSTPPWSSEPPP
jgi:hypothetical protein